MMTDSTTFVLVACVVVACAVVAVLVSDYTSRPPEPVTSVPDAPYADLIAVTCAGVFIATADGGCDAIQIRCQFPDGRIESGKQTCEAGK